MIVDLDNYETWLSLPILAVLITYHYYLTLGISNVYKLEHHILIEHAIKGQFVFDKHELIDVKSNLFFNKIYFDGITFRFFHSAGFIKAVLLAGEKDYEQDIKQILIK